MRLRPAAVAGTFYPASEPELRVTVEQCFAASVAPPGGARSPRAIVVPHAGLQYSGPIAASAYSRLAARRDTIRRVVLLGPSHRVSFSGVATSTAEVWETPLGSVSIDRPFVERLESLDGVVALDAAHAGEHSLEVQLPFLQTVLSEFALVPLVVGSAGDDVVAAVIEAGCSDDDTLVVVSTDLSHYHPYADAVRIDLQTAAAVLACRSDRLGSAQACGARPLRGLLDVARAHQMDVEQLDLRNSGDTAGDRERVVGYGAFALT